MASYSVTAGQRGAYAKTLVASTVDTITFTDDLSRIEVGTTDGAAAIYFTVDGSTPTVAGASTYIIPGVANAVREITEVPSVAQLSTVKLISSGTPTYWVAKA
jgi:hypothetical protein